MYKITIPNDYSGERYGMTFIKGIANTDNERMILIMKKKGFHVEKIEEKKKSK